MAHNKVIKYYLKINISSYFVFGQRMTGDFLSNVLFFLFIAR